MKKVIRDELKKIFKKAKHLRIPQDFDTVEFENLHYYAWLDETDKDYFMVYERNGSLDGIRFEITNFSNVGVKLGVCSICGKSKPLGQIMLVTAKTRYRPDGIDYRVRGNYVCADHVACNEKMVDEEGIEKLFASICDDSESSK